MQDIYVNSKGGVCSLDVLDENEVRVSSAIVKYRDLTVQESLTVF